MNRGRFRNNRNNQHRSDKKVDSIPSGDDNNPVVRSFRNYANELNDKHDRYERIVKFSRDITIESKRLIFLLHTVDMRKQNAKKILTEALERLNNLCASSFRQIAKELQNCDPYQYARAYSAGLQEFVEAFTYYDYLFNDHIINWTDLQARLTYTVKPNSVSTDVATTETRIETANLEESTEAVAGNEVNPETTPEKEDDLEGLKEITCLVQPIEFMLGLADLSGEIMRKCINSLGSGDIETCHKACNFVQHLYSG